MASQGRVKRTPKEKKYYIHSAIGLAIMFFFGFIPEFGPVTESGMFCLGIFIGLIYLWSMVDMGWPIFAAFIALIVYDIMPITEIYTSAFANPTVMLCLFNLLVLMPLAGCGVFNYVAVWLLKRPMFKGHPWRLTISIFILMYVGSIPQAGLAVLFMVYELVYKICDLSGMKRTHPWAGAVIMGSVVSMMCGAGIFPFGQLALFYAGLFSAVAIIEWPFIPFIIFMVSMWLLLMGIYLVIMRFVCKDLRELKEVDVAASVKELPPISKTQRQSGILLIIFMVCLIIAGITPNFSGNIIVDTINKLGLVGVSWLFMCIMLIWRIKEKPAYSLTQMAGATPWEAVMITCLGMAFGPVVTDESTGITDLIYQLTVPVFADHSPFVFVLLLAFIAMVLTNFFNNTVVAMLMIAIVASYAGTMELNMIAVAAMILASTQIAFLTPGACFNASLAHGQAEHVGRKSGFFWGGIVMVCGAISLPILLLLGNAIF